jgi:hypothetical protein
VANTQSIELWCVSFPLDLRPPEFFNSIGTFQTGWKGNQGGPDDSFRAQSGPEVLDCPTAANDALLSSAGSAILGADRPLIARKGRFYENPDTVFQET